MSVTHSPICADNADTGAVIVSPERALAAAVILQAIEDAKSLRRNISEQTRAQATAFLTQQHGPWATARKRWCAWAGLDPEAVEQRLGRLIA